MHTRKFLLVSSLVLALAASSSAWAQEPTVQASGVTVDRFSGRSMRISWTRGDGDGSIVVMRVLGTTKVDPADGDDYVPDRDYSATPGSELNPPGSDNWVVHKGPGNQVWVLGLTVNSTYSIAVYEYAGTGAATDYLLGPDELDQSTSHLASHNEDLGIDCSDCHYHSSFGARDTELQAVCENCHNPDGVANTKLMFANHKEPLKNQDVDFVDCGVCHEVHLPGAVNTTESTHFVTGLTQQNKSFLRANVDKYISGAATPAYLHTDQPLRAADNPNGDPEAAADTPDRAVEGGDATTARGYCQVCHTLTNYHRSTGDADPIATGFPECHDGSGNASCGEFGIGGNPVQDPSFEVQCGSCHEHNNRFEGAGSCTACHANKQPDPVNGPRPVITTMFDRRSTHIPGGSGSVAQEDCEVCHDQLTHNQPANPDGQKVRLWNADDGTTSYAQATSGGDTLAEGAAFTPHCLSCHDGSADSLPDYAGTTDGQTKTSPFNTSGGPDPIANVNDYWSTSGHNAGGMSCVGDGTNGCHGSGHGSEQDTLLAPAVGTLLTIQEFCFTCHNGTVASTDVEAEFTNLALLANLPNNAPIESGSGALVDNYHDLAVVSCGDCHSPHVDNPSAATPVMGDPDTGIPVAFYQATGAGASYNEDGKTFDYFSAAGDLDPVNPEGATLGPFQELDYIQFCLACHDGTTPPGVTMTDQMLNIADAYGGIGQTAQDVHGGGAASGQGSSTNRGGMKIPWVTAADDALNYDPTGPYAALNCTTCHGAHGTENIFNLRTEIWVAGVKMSVGGVGNMPIPDRVSADPSVYTLPSLQPRRNDPIGQYDHYWGAWCSFCHKMDGGHQNVDELDKCTSGHMHGGGAF